MTKSKRKKIILLLIALLLFPKITNAKEKEIGFHKKYLNISYKSKSKYCKNGTYCAYNRAYLNNDGVVAYCLSPNKKARYSVTPVYFDTKTSPTEKECMYNYILQKKLAENDTYHDLSSLDGQYYYMIRSAAARIIANGRSVVYSSTAVDENNREYELGNHNKIKKNAVALVNEAKEYCTNNGNKIYSSSTGESQDPPVIKIIREADRNLVNDDGTQTLNQARYVIFKISLSNFKNTDSISRKFVIESITGINMKVLGYTTILPDNLEEGTYINPTNLNVFSNSELTSCNENDACSATLYLVTKFETSNSNAEKNSELCKQNITINYANSLNKSGSGTRCWIATGATVVQNFVGCKQDDATENRDSIKFPITETCSNACEPKITMPLECGDENSEYVYKEGIKNGEENIGDCVIDNSDKKGNEYLVLQNDYCSIYCKEDYNIKLPGRKYTNSGRYINIDVNIKGSMSCYSTKIDTNKLRNNCNQEKLDEFNQCLNFTVPFEVNPTISYFYDEPYEKDDDGKYKCETDRSTWLKLAKQKLGEGASTFEKITTEENITTTTYCSSVNDYKCTGGTSEQTVTCSSIPNDLYVNKVASTPEGGIDFKTPRIYYISHPSGNIIISDASSESEMEKIQKSDLIDGLPIGLKTPEGTYYYGITINGLGTFFEKTNVISTETNNKDTLGRIFGDEGQNVSDIRGRKTVKDPACHKNIEVDKNSYVCTYNVNDDGCKDEYGNVYYYDEYCKEGESREICIKRVKNEKCYHCKTHCIECIGMSCDPDPNKPINGLQIDYRTITTNNINPNNRELGYNWDINNKINEKVAEKASKTISEIEQRASNYGTTEYETVNDYTFKVTLTPDVTKKVKDYNKKNNGVYANDTLTCYNYPIDNIKQEETCKKAGYTWEWAENDTDIEESVNDTKGTCYAKNVFCYSNFIDEVLGDDPNGQRAKSKSAAANNEYISTRYKENALKVNDYWTVYSYVSLDENGDNIPDIGISWK